MEVNTVTEPIRVVTTTRNSAGEIESPDADIETLIEAIESDEQLIIYRSAYSREEMATVRRAILDWGEANEAWPQGVSASKEAINFHRVDDGKITGRMAHIFHQFGFGDPEGLSEPLKGFMARLRREVFDLQNRLAGTDYHLDTPEFRTKAIRHPRGGGYLVPHAHPYLPQKVAVFLNLSEPGEDYQNGAMRFRTSDGEWISTFNELRCGDLVAWRYSMVHEAAAVDPEAEIDWSCDKGLWIFAIEHVPVHELSESVEK